MKKSLVILLSCFEFIYSLDDKTEAQREYEAGNALFVNRQYSDALTHYHKAIELNPTMYQAIFRRATTYLAFGRSKPGLADLDTVLSQKPDFAGARQQRASVLLKMGQLERAAADFRYLIDHSASQETSQEAQEKLELISEHINQVEMLKSWITNGDCNNVIESTTHLLETQPWDASLYIYRAKCYVAEDKVKSAIHDMKHAAKLSSDNTELLFEMSELEYKVADVRDSLGSIRECLKLNPDHKKCYTSYKSLKKIVKSLDSMKASIEQQEWTKCLETGEKLLKKNEEIPIRMNIFRLMCQCNREDGNLGEAIQQCTRVLEFDDSDVETLIQRAEAYMADEEYDMAIADYEKAGEWDSSNDAVRTGKDQAKRAKELVGKRDYYKILGVRRNANKREITKAYRKMAQKWHPDNFQDEKEKKKAEKKFIDIAAAKEVLSNEEKRRAFDNGQDPLDSEAGRGGGGGGGSHGFHNFHGFNPFGGGGGGGRGGGDFFFHF